MTDPTLVPLDALSGVRIALSVSNSADLNRLGLTKDHLTLVVAELSRAIMLSGGIVVYGGRLRPAGFTEVIMNEVRRYGDARHALEIYVARPEFRDITISELRLIDSRLGTSGSVKFLSDAGEIVSLADIENGLPSSSCADMDALSNMRRTVSNVADARILVGGKLADYDGAEPGLIEEARLTLELSKPIYVSGGFGGAGAAIAQSLAFDAFEWAPKDFPVGKKSAETVASLTRLRKTFETQDVSDGLSASERKTLAVSHRPGDIASTAVRGLARALHHRSGGAG